MRKLVFLLSIFLYAFAMFSCKNDGIVVTLKVLNANGNYESFKIKKFEEGEKLVDRITQPADNATDELKALYNEKDKTLYNDIIKSVTLKNDYKYEDNVVFTVGTVLVFTGWQDKKQGETDSTVWNVNTELNKNITVYAHYEELVLQPVSLEISLADCNFAYVEETDKFVSNVGAADDERDSQFKATVTLTGATFKNITKEAAAGMISVSGVEQDNRSIAVDENIENGVDAFSFTVTFTAIEPPDEETTVNGGITVTVNPENLNIVNGYISSAENIEKEVSFSVTYGARPLVTMVLLSSQQLVYNESEDVYVKDITADAVGVEAEVTFGWYVKFVKVVGLEPETRENILDLDIDNLTFTTHSPVLKVGDEDYTVVELIQNPEESYATDPTAVSVTQSNGRFPAFHASWSVHGVDSSEGDVVKSGTVRIIFPGSALVPQEGYRIPESFVAEYKYKIIHRQKS